MPGLPLAIRETTNHGCSCSQSRTAGQMCRQQSRVRLTAEEQLAAEESLSIYCKPVELYNILQRRAIQNPSFLQRCLHYKILAKRKRRIQITVSLIRDRNVEVEQQNFFPLYVLLARPVVDVGVAELSAVYRLSRPCILTNFSEFGKEGQTEARFIIPEIKKLASDARVSDLNIIIVSKGESNSASGESHLVNDFREFSWLSKLEGNCLWGKTPVDSLCLSLEKCVTLSLGHRADMISAFDMQPGVLETKYLDRSDCIFFHSQNIDPTISLQVQVSISVQEVGATETSPYDSYSYDGVPTSSLPHIIRLRKGNVLFNYRYYNNTLQKTEVTEDFSCPFCLVKCSSFKGLGYHLSSSHDLFNFEFWVTDEYQAVNVSVRTDIWKSEVLSDGVDPRLQTFIYCSNKRRRKMKNPVQNASYVHPHVLESGSPEATQEDDNANGTYSSQRPLVHATNVELSNGCNDGASYNDEGKWHKSIFSDTPMLSARQRSESAASRNLHAAEHTELVSSSPGTADVYAATAQASSSSNFAQQVSGSNLAPQYMLQFGKMRKISDDRADPRNRMLLQKRQFFHSHRAQPMALEQVFSDQDSEDEVDDDIADFEDRRMLDDFVDVTKDEKHIMHLWNSFVRKQRVLADGHIPWACEAFCRLHGPDLLRSPALLRNWMLLKIKLWNHNLLDSRSFDNCSLILEKFQNENLVPKQC